MKYMLSILLMFFSTVCFADILMTQGHPVCSGTVIKSLSNGIEFTCEKGLGIVNIDNCLYYGTCIVLRQLK